MPYEDRRVLDRMQRRRLKAEINLNDKALTTPLLL